MSKQHHFERCEKCGHGRTPGDGAKCAQHRALFYKLYRQANGQRHPDEPRKPRGMHSSNQRQVDNEPLRRAALLSGQSWYALAKTAAVRCPMAAADAPPVAGRLGELGMYGRATISEKRALQLLPVLGLDPVDVGL